MGAPLSPRHDAPGPTAARHGRQHTAQSSDCSWVTYIPWGSGGAGGDTLPSAALPGRLAVRTRSPSFPPGTARSGERPHELPKPGGPRGGVWPSRGQGTSQLSPPPPSFPCCFRSPTSGTARGGWEGPVLPEAVGHGVLPPSCPTTRPHVPPAGATSLPPALCYLQAAEVSSLLSGRGGPASAPQKTQGLATQGSNTTQTTAPSFGSPPALLLRAQQQHGGPLCPHGGHPHRKPPPPLRPRLVPPPMGPLPANPPHPPTATFAVPGATLTTPPRGLHITLKHHVGLGSPRAAAPCGQPQAGQGGRQIL